MDDLKTGDIILFNEHPYNGWLACVDWAIRCWTRSRYSHVGIIVVDPPWTKKGTYVWDSSKHVHKDPEDGKIKYGIALVPLRDYVEYSGGKQRLYKRSPQNPKTYDKFTDEALMKIHDKVYGCHYDTMVGHWLAAMVHILIPRTDKTFWCSAFVSYALTTVGILDVETDWTIVSPVDLSEKGIKLKWNLEYGPDILFSSN
tara:strand:+ start:1135 stop:1734 length:600 start_codon:yes stop_codon:yes gene_type:complete